MTHNNWANEDSPNHTSEEAAQHTRSIADTYADLLAPLSQRQRKGIIAQLSVGYYEGWRPSRREIQELVTQELRRGIHHQPATTPWPP
jgi:hypothetical protein